MAFDIASTPLVRTMEHIASHMAIETQTDNILFITHSTHARHQLPAHFIFQEHICIFACLSIGYGIVADYLPFSWIILYIILLLILGSYVLKENGNLEGRRV